MKKITGILMATTLSVTLALTSISCATTPASTTTPPTTTPPGTTTPVEVPGQKTAIEFIKNSSTFKFDGIEGSIKFIQDDTKFLSSVGSSLLLFEFQTRHPGHGDRTGQFLAQVITTHKAVIQVNLEKETIINAVCDGNWDMLTEKAVPEVVQVDKLEIAENFIKDSATFRFDGIESSLKMVKAEDGTTSAFPSRIFTIEFQTQHPGHGDRTGKALAQVITNHTAVITVDIQKDEVKKAVCDETWDMAAEKNVTIAIDGIVISGGDTTPADGPTDAPRIFTFKVQKADGTFVNVSYTAYPPSPVGDEQQKKITLKFHGGSVQIGDFMQAMGTYDPETKTIIVNDQGNYIFTMITEEAALKLATDFMDKDNATFKFDGIAGSLKHVQTDPGPTSAFRSTSFVFTFQTQHPGHGDRTGQVLAQVITDHTARLLVDMEKGVVISAICDNSWDMIKNQELPVHISGYVISGGDTSPANGPTDTPRTFTYKVQKADGTFVYVSYTAYPPSPVGDAQKEKITLEFYNGEIKAGDKIEALGMLDKETNTIKIANQGDYIRTYAPKMEIVGKVMEGGDTTPADGPKDAPRTFVYKIQKDDGTVVSVTFTAYPPSPAGDEARNKITLSYYDGEPKAGDYMKVYGTFDAATGTITVVDQSDFIKTYPEKP